MSRKRVSLETSYIAGFVPWSIWHKEETANETIKPPLMFWDWSRPSEEARRRYVPAAPEHETWFAREYEIRMRLFSLVRHGFRPGMGDDCGGLKEAAQREGAMDLYLRAKREIDVSVLLARMEETVLQDIYRIIHSLEDMVVDPPYTAEGVRERLQCAPFHLLWNFNTESLQGDRHGVILTTGELTTAIRANIQELAESPALVFRAETLSLWPEGIQRIQEILRQVIRAIRGVLVGKLETWTSDPIPFPKEVTSIWGEYERSLVYEGGKPLAAAVTRI